MIIKHLILHFLDKRKYFYFWSHKCHKGYIRNFPAVSEKIALLGIIISSVSNSSNVADTMYVHGEKFNHV